MSKIAEQKALEEYPIKIDRIYYGLPLINGAEPFTDDVNIHQRNAYIQGYDKAMKDFLEKAEMYLKTRVYYNMHPNNVTIAIQEFKNYIENESEE